jgi:hypothetical protein
MGKRLDELGGDLKRAWDRAVNPPPGTVPDRWRGPQPAPPPENAPGDDNSNAPGDDYPNR